MTSFRKPGRAARVLALGQVLLLSMAALSCAQVKPAPATLDAAHDDCTYCRMRVSDQRFAAQIVVPGEEPRFFDDIGCLVKELNERPRDPAAVAYVADHRTGEWVPAATASYVRLLSLATPMNSHLVAHAAKQSRNSDPEARGGELLSAAQVFGNVRIPDGTSK